MHVRGTGYGTGSHVYGGRGVPPPAGCQLEARGAWGIIQSKSRGPRTRSCGACRQDMDVPAQEERELAFPHLWFHWGPSGWHDDHPTGEAGLPQSPGQMLTFSETLLQTHRNQSCQRCGHPLGKLAEFPVTRALQRHGVRACWGLCMEVQDRPPRA